MKAILYLIFISLLPVSLWAQSTLLKGRIVNANNQKGIAYTNIGIEGTYMGTASDQDGYFQLELPKEQRQGQLTVSAVGYQAQTLSIRKFIDKDFIRIALKPQIYAIKDIDIEAQSRVLFRVLKTASSRIPQNYQTGPLGMRIHFYENTQTDTMPAQIREAIVDVYDADGYQKPSITDAFMNRRFHFREVNKNFKSYSFYEGQTGLEELLEMDIARQRTTIMNPDLLDDYDLKLESPQKYGQDSVWVISYRTKKADLAHSGDYYASTMEGEIYISKSNYAIVRNVFKVQSQKNSPQNRSLYTQSRDQQKVEYTTVCNYRKYNGKYAPSYIECKKSFLNAQGKQVSYTRKAGILQLVKSPDPIAEKDYFEHTVYRKNFWDQFHQQQQ